MRVWTSTILVLVLTAFAASAWADTNEEVYRNHLLVKVKPGSIQRLKEFYLLRNELDIVGGETPEEPYVVALPEDLTYLESLGYEYEILQQNLEAYYASRLNVPLERDSLGGYYTFYDIVQFLDSLHTAFPNITTAKFSIGNSIQGRPLWVLKISDNPTVDENEAEVFYNSLIHAREPAAMEAVLHFMRYLCYNYASNSDVQYLVNNRELFFLPCVNPDGYEYNRQTNPSGGGQWRKNRRNNGDGSYGIDLNRNFGLTWGLDNNGSSPTPSSDTYRGTAAFSEPETQAIRDFVNSRQFVTEIDYHTYSNLVIYPWGTSYYDGDGLTEDNSTFQMIADSMVYYIQQVNGAAYSPGTAWQLLYNVNGGSVDWEYGDNANHLKIFAVTTEVGSSSDGFWPPQSRIAPLAAENLPANLFMARIAGTLMPRPYQVTFNSQCQAEWNGDGDGTTEPGEGFTLTVSLKNTGTQNLTGIQGVLSTISPYATVITNTSPWPNLNTNQIGANSTAFQVSISGGAPNLLFVPLSLRITATGLDTTVSLLATVGRSSLVDNVEGGVGGWTTGGTNNQWHITTRRSFSPTHAWMAGTDAGNYADNMNAYLLSDTLILGPGAQLEYDTWYALETGYDYGHFEVNTGSGWVEVGTPVNGNSGGWLHVTQNLGITCAGTRVQVRFRLTSDSNTNAEGWYLDNFNTGCPGVPDVTVNPMSLTGIAPLGGSDAEPIQICNTGQCPMTYSVAFYQLTPPLPLLGDIMPAFSTGVASAGLPIDLVAVKDSYEEPAPERNPLDAQGGPDGGGYRWKDSNEPGGPSYDWVEIAGIGTNVGFTGDDQVVPLTLPWNFPFYGVNYTTMRLSANGKAHFSADSSDWRNLPVPDRRNPQAIIAPFWDDLSPQQSGAAVYYYHDVVNNRFIVQYDSVPHYPGLNNGRYTFEMILYPSGRIIFQYQNLIGDLNSCTVGIENATGTIGLPVVYNANYLTNGLAIAISNQQPWGTLAGPTSGSLEAGQCVNLQLNFSAGSLAAGIYSGNLVVTTNDPDELTTTVPVSFIVGQLDPPAGLVIFHNPDAETLTFTWQGTGAPQYKVYSSSVPEGPFTTLVGTTTGTTLTIPQPADLKLFYVVVSAN